MIDEIANSDDLKLYRVSKCEDNEVCVETHSDINDDEYIIIKLDDYYNGLHEDPTPPSVDCLIVQRCQQGFKVYLIELKNVKRAKSINRANLIEKYRTALFDFLSGRYQSIFNGYDFHPELMLCAGHVSGDTINSFNLDFLLGLPLIKFRGKLCGINGRPPHPIINPC